MIWLSTEYFHGMEIWTFLDVGTGMVPTNPRSMRQSGTWELSVFSHTFSAIWEFAHRVVWELYGFLLHKYLATHNFGMFFFPILLPYYGNSLIPCFGNCMDFCFTRNILISRNNKYYYAKPLTFECFAISFSTHWVCTFCILEKRNPNSKE